MTFRNSSNTYMVKTTMPFLWCLLLGPLYFLKHEAWAAAAISLLLAFVTVGISWLFMPFTAAGFIRSSYFAARLGDGR